jgi:hypothetical protein
MPGDNAVMHSSKGDGRMSVSYTWIARVFQKGERLFEATKQSAVKVPKKDNIEEMQDGRGKTHRVRVLHNEYSFTKPRQSGLGIVKFDAELISDHTPKEKGSSP